MTVVYLAALCLGALLLLIATLLCGQNPLFARTPLPRLHRLLVRGGSSAAHSTAAAAGRLGGRRASAALEAAADLCCERSNPAVQILFLALVGGCFAAYCFFIFPLLPLPGVPAWHKHTGTAAMLACLSLFLITSFTDPGTVTPANAAAHAALYPADGMLYPEGKQCSTCLLPRPARSKHCRVCGRCVARLDHHCIWINNCVGLLNMRWFLAFLLSTAMLCSYAALLGLQVLRADMASQDTWNIAFLDRNTGKLVYLSDNLGFLRRYLITAYAPQVAVIFFTGVCAAIVYGFTGFQLHMLCTGTTTVEHHKRGELAEALELEEEARQLQARADAVLAGRQPGSKAGADLRQQRHAQAAAAAAPGAISSAENGRAEAVDQRQHGRLRRGRRCVPRPYHRGVWRNLCEVLFPHHHLRLAAAMAGDGAPPSGGKKLA